MLAALFKKPYGGESEDGLCPLQESMKLRASAPSRVLSHPALIAQTQRTEQRQKVAQKMSPNWGFDPFHPIFLFAEGVSQQIDLQLGSPISGLLCARLLGLVRPRHDVIQPTIQV